MELKTLQMAHFGEDSTLHIKKQDPDPHQSDQADRNLKFELKHTSSLKCGITTVNIFFIGLKIGHVGPGSGSGWIRNYGVIGHLNPDPESTSGLGIRESRRNI